MGLWCVGPTLGVYTPKSVTPLALSAHHCPQKNVWPGQHLEQKKRGGNRRERTPKVPHLLPGKRPPPPTPGGERGGGVAPEPSELRREESSPLGTRCREVLKGKWHTQRHLRIRLASGSHPAAAAAPAAPEGGKKGRGTHQRVGSSE